MNDPKNPSPAQREADRQQWARNLIARHRRAMSQVVQTEMALNIAKAEYRRVAEAKVQHIKARRALFKLEAKLMEALTER